MNDPYETLGVNRDASQKEINDAYRKAARKHHPDAGGDAEQFKLIASAHMILSDDPNRAHFDRTGSERGPANACESRIAVLDHGYFGLDDLMTPNKELRLVLIGCSKTKLPYVPDRRRGGRIKPIEMYGGQLFRKRVECAEKRGLPWRVLSAEYGAWRPDDDRKPYDETLADKSPADFAIWHAKVAYDLLHELWERYDNGDAEGPQRPSEMTIEIHAGKLYSRPLADILQSLGVNVELPCEGLGIGEQLALYTSGRLAIASAQ